MQPSSSPKTLNCQFSTVNSPINAKNAGTMCQRSRLLNDDEQPLLLCTLRVRRDDRVRTDDLCNVTAAL